MSSKLLKIFLDKNTNFYDFDIIVKNQKLDCNELISSPWLHKELCKTIVNYLSEKEQLRQKVKDAVLFETAEEGRRKLAQSLNVSLSDIEIDKQKDGYVVTVSIAGRDFSFWIEQQPITV